VNQSLPKNVLLFGAECAPAPDVLLRAGPLNIIFREGVFRYIKLQAREVIRAVYVAVRDENWHTIPGVISNLEIHSAAGSFKITYDCVHQERGIDFRWKVVVCGSENGTILWKMKGQAFTSFLKNRIGICVLHPIDETIGEPCEITHTDGTKEQSCFPVTVAPHQPFLDLAAISFPVNSGLVAELSFAGDVFETEDQRNWTDASFKTYSTPLSLPYPVRIEEGAMVSQSVRLALRGRLPAANNHRPTGEEVALTLHPGVRTSLPRIGFKWAGSRHPLSEGGALRLRALRADHLSVDLHPGNAASEVEFWKAIDEARRMSLPVEVALAAVAESVAVMRALQKIVDCKVNICLWLADVGLQLPARIAELKALQAIAPVAFGAGAHFAELNRNRPATSPGSGVWFSLNPQAHATDHTTLIENLAAQSSVLSSIRAWAGSIPISVSPITLRTRATSNPEVESSPNLPEDVDPRQSSLLGAAWTLGSLRHQAEGGVASVTFFETAGWKGIMEGQQGSQLSFRPFSIPDAVFPMYHVFAEVAAFKGAEVVRTESTDPLKVECMALIQTSGLRVLAANLSANEVTVTLKLSRTAARGELRIMDEDNVELCMVRPESYREQSPHQLVDDEKGWRFDLMPFAIATIDAPPGSLHPEIGSSMTGGCE